MFFFAAYNVSKARLFHSYSPMHICRGNALSDPLCSVCNNYKYTLSMYLKAERTKNRRIGRTRRKGIG